MKITGKHKIGRGRARTLGFPTINLHEINSVIVDNGIYAARVYINDKQFKAALFIGESPTFKDKEKSIELYLIGLAEGELKNNHLDGLITSKITVEIVQYLRPVIQFGSREKLVAQIKADIEKIQSILALN